MAVREETWEKFTDVCNDINHGESVAKACKANGLSQATYYKLREIPTGATTPTTIPVPTRTIETVAVIVCRPDQISAVISGMI